MWLVSSSPGYATAGAFFARYYADASTARQLRRLNEMVRVLAAGPKSTGFALRADVEPWSRRQRLPKPYGDSSQQKRGGRVMNPYATQGPF
jgi:hypothetical protein